MKNLLLFLIAFFVINASSAQWQQTKGPCNGSIKCIAQIDDYMFAGTYSSGVYLSSDNANSWTAVNNGLTNLNVTSITTNGNSIIIGTSGSGMFLSTDLGNNWKAINNGLPLGRIDILSLTVCDGIIYAGTSGYGIYVSTDNGQSWVPSSNGLISKVIWSLASDGGRIFAGSQDDGPYISTDKGATWTPINKGIPKLSLAIRSFAFKGNDWFIATGTNYGGGIFRSSDNGASWTAINSGLSSLGIFTNTLLRINDDIWVGTNDGVYISKDNGEHWIQHNSGFVYPFTVVNALAIKDDNIFAGTESTGMFLSTDNGDNWEPKNSGIIQSAITSLVVKDGNIFAGNFANGVFKSSDEGENWTAVNNGLWNKDVAELLVVDDNLLAGAGCGGAFLSTDNAEHWNSVSNGMHFESGRPFICISSLVADKDLIYAGSNYGVYVSDDMANSWTSINQGLPASTWDIKLAANGNNLYAGTNTGMYLSTNKGESWSAINTGLNQPIKAIVINGDCIFAGTQGEGVYISKNNGNTWTKANVGLTNLNIRAFCRSGSNIYVATDGGVFLSKDNGLKWISFNEGWDNKLVRSLAIFSEYLYAGTSEGVWKRSINEDAKVAISGIVTDSNGEAVEGVTLQGLPANPQTDSNGYFIDSVSVGWSGKITPIRNGYDFTPDSRSFSTISTNQENQDFSGEFKSIRSISVSPTSITVYQPAGASPNSPSLTFINNDQLNTGSSIGDKSARSLNHAMGCVIPDSVVEYWKNHEPAAVVHLKSYTPTIDWSINDSPVKDQGACGSCWAFAACAYIENVGTQVDLSEQTILSCGNSGSCEGGYYEGAMQFIQSQGIPDEACYPYAQISGSCNSMCSNFSYKEKIKTVSNELWGIATVDLLKSELQNGPLIVSMQVPMDIAFEQYQSGIYHYNGGVIPPGRGHAVLLVGYNDEQKCFKVKNSWGAGWGENGYFRISYDDVSNEVAFGSYAMNGSGVYTENLSNSSIVISAGGNDNLTIESISSDKEWLTTSGHPEDSFDMLPSTSQNMIVSVYWNKLSSFTETGTITIQSNDPEKPLVTIKVTAFPKCTAMLDATVNVDGNTTFCMGDYAVLNATTGDNLIYQWKKNGVIIPEANGNSYIVTSGGAYSVEITQVGTNCFAESLPVAIVVNQLPPPPSINLEGGKLRSNRLSGNQWYDNNGPIAGAVNQYFQPEKSGDYYLISIKNNCHSLASNTIHYTATDISSNTLNKTTRIYPNPVGNELIIESAGNQGKTVFEIINSTGQVVLTGNFTKKVNLNTSSLPSGAYLVRLMNGNTFEFKKFIKK